MTDRELLESIRRQIDAQLAPAAPPPTDPPPAPTERLKILQWNAHHGGQRTDGRTDMVGFAGWVARIAPDVACHQEIDGESSAQLEDKILRGILPMWSYAWSGTRGNTIHTILPHLPVSMITTANDQGRGIVPLLTLTLTGGPVSIASVHLDAYDEGKRLAEIAVLLDATNPPDILAGDFNCQSTSKPYARIRDLYDDAWIAAGAIGAAVNYPGNCDGCTKNSRIDYVFVRKGCGWRVLKAEILDTRETGGIMPSDHKPLVVTLGR